MPREVIAIGPGKVEIREYQELDLGSNDIRIRTEFASPKHGTESHGFTVESPFDGRYFDDEYRIFLPKKTTEANFPRPLGNMAVGVVIDAGKDTTRFKVGDRVYGHLPIRETQTVCERRGELGPIRPGLGVRESRIHQLPSRMTPQEAVLLDPCHFALGAVRDANIRLGEWVAVYGLGAIGLMIVQMALLSGAERVLAVDPLENRRDLALKLGAEEALNPASCDAGHEIKKTTGKRGVDVAIDASGSYQALQAAIRSVHYAGRVVSCSFYHGERTPLHLDEEFFLARITVEASLPVWGNPSRDYPMWDDERLEDTVFRLMQRKSVKVEGIIHPVYPFDQAVEAYREIHEHPDRCVKLGIVFGE
jgi:2-desacetyl-2-hydroxyethyl bacteriochlorophyllide A dehydrogenase